MVTNGPQMMTVESSRAPPVADSGNCIRITNIVWNLASSTVKTCTDTCVPDHSASAVASHHLLMMFKCLRG